MKIKLGMTKAQALKIAKVAAYIAASSVISYLISLIADDPNLVGPLTPLVNLVLYGVKQFLVAPEVK